MTESLKEKLVNLQSGCYKTFKTNTRTGSMVVSAAQMARKEAFDEVIPLLEKAIRQIKEKAGIYPHYFIMLKDVLAILGNEEKEKGQA